MLTNTLNSEVKSDAVKWTDLLFGLDINLNYSLRDKMLLSSSCPGLKLSPKLYELLILFIFLYRFPFILGT